ncbi:MAG: hypothetical protein R2828_33875 [Saprospiraceae bacterium]
MQVLKELALIVNNNRLLQVELLDASAKDASKVEVYYRSLIDNKFSSDDEAAQFFYGENKAHPAYQKLRHKLKRKLVNHLFFLNAKEPSNSDRYQAFYECYRDWAAAKILFAKNASHAGINLCFNILKQAKKYEFTELTVDVARTLRVHFGTLVGDVKKFEQYNDLFKEYSKINESEDLAEELYTELVLHFANIKANNKQINAKAKESFEKLKPALQKYKTYRLHLCAALIRLTAFSSVNNYKETAKLCQEYINFFEKKNYLASAPLQIFYYQLLVCNIQLKQYEEGKAAAESCLEVLTEGSFNWFKYQELYFLLSMHTHQYQEAYHLFLQIIQHKRFAFLPENVKEMWKIFEAYIHYLVLIRKVKLSRKDKHFTKFRLGRFLNATPIYSKDKRGMNIPILVVQVLFMILQRNYNSAIDRIEAIEKYCSRYLTKDDTFRSNCFIKMLLQIPHCGFHKAGVERKTSKYLNRLQTMPLDVAKQSHEIEIIPYEELWELVIDSLENKFFNQTEKVESTVL